MTPFKRPYFLDTTALIKLVKPEPGSEYMRSLVEAGEGFLYTSQLAVVEAAGVLKREWLSDLKRATTHEENLAVFQRYEKRLRDLYFSHLRGIRVLPSAFDDRGAVWNALREIREKRKKVDVIDLLHVYQLLTEKFSTPGGQSPPVLVSSDSDLKAYCDSEGIDILDPEESKAGDG